MIGFTHKNTWIVGGLLLLLLTAACEPAQTPTPTPLNPGLFPPPGTTGPNAHTPVITPLSDGAEGAVTLPAGSATAQPLVLPTAGLGGAATVAANTCVTPTGWVAYTVTAGDTLGTLATAHGITVAQLASSNCLTNADVIDVGQIIYVPGSTTAGANSITATP